MVRNLYFMDLVASPDETDSELIVDPNAVLPLPVSMQFFQSVTRGETQVAEVDCAVQHGEFSHSDAGGRRAPCLTCSPDFRRLPVGETLDHCLTITLSVNNVNRY